MTCTTYDTHCGTLGDGRKDDKAPRRQDARSRLARLVSQIGEGLFHYRYVRAELIERALERQADDREARP